MSDIYGAFANAYKSGDIQIKADPKRVFNLFTETKDLENNQQTQSTQGNGNALQNSFQSIKSKLFSSSESQNQSQNTAGAPPKPIQFVISKMDDKKDYTKAIICFIISGVFLMFATLSLPSIILSPQTFTSLFTISMISLIFALAFLNGPATYVKKLSESKNIFASAVMVISTILSLYFSIIQGSYLLSILFCFIEFNAVMLFFCNTFPAGKQGMKLFGGAAKTMLTAPFK